MRTCHECLEKFSLAELDEVMLRLAMEPLPGKRADKALAVEEFLSTAEGVAFLRRALGCELIDKLRKTLGTVGDGCVSLTDYHDAPVLADALDCLHAFGMAYRDRAGWHMLPQVKKVVTRVPRPAHQELEAMDELFQEVEALLAIHGMICIDDLPALLNIPMSPDTLLPLLVLRWGMEPVYCDADEHVYIMSEELDDPVALMHQWSLLPASVTRAKATEDRMDDAALLGLPCDISILDDLFKELSEKEMVLAFRDLLLDVENAPCLPTDILPWALSEVQEMAGGEKLSPKAVLLLTNLIRTMSLWQLRGHSLVEYEGLLSVRQTAKVGRNDPCPCGSGRKYKNCCGRFQ